MFKNLYPFGQTITSLAVHPSLPYIIASASTDESISLCDISVVVAQPDPLVNNFKDPHMEGKRWKGHAEGESSLEVLAGFAGHVEAVLSIVIGHFKPSGMRFLNM